MICFVKPNGKHDCIYLIKHKQNQASIVIYGTSLNKYIYTVLYAKFNQELSLGKQYS